MQTDLKHIRSQVEARVKIERQEFELDEPDSSIPSQDIWSACQAEQDGDACLFVELFRGQFVFDHAAGCWYKWQGHYWADDKVEDVITALDDVINLYDQEAQKLNWQASNAEKKQNQNEEKDLKKKIEKYRNKIHKLQKKQWKKSVLELAAAGDRGLSMVGDEWDQNPYLLACPNGVVDLRTGILRNGIPDDYIKTMAPTEFKGLNFEAPRWESCLFEIFNNDEKLIKFVQRLLGYSITGLSTEHILPILWGQGRNGKSTILEIIAHALGPLAGPVKAELLLSQGRLRSSAAPDPDLMALRGRRIAWASESDEGHKIDSAKIKLLTGGDTIVARPPYGRHETRFSPTHTLLLLTNHKPRVQADDDAIWERIHLIYFSMKFVDKPSKKNEKKREPDLLEKLKEEAPGILAWLVRGCLQWQKQGLNPPGSIQEATIDYQKGEDIVEQFKEERCIINSNTKVQAKPLYEEFCNWCEENQHLPISQTKFGEWMKTRFKGERTRNGIFYSGVGLLNETEQV